MQEWFDAFHDKIPILTKENFDQCLIIAKIRPYSQITWGTLHQRLVAAMQSQPPTSLYVTIATSQDPSKIT